MRPASLLIPRSYAQIHDQPEVVYKKGDAAGTTVSRAMSGRVKRHVLCLQMLNRTKNTKLRKAILECADADLISALCECAHNILRGTVRLTPREKVRLRKYKDKLRLIANRRLSISRRRREIQQHGGGFLPALLAPLATTVFLPLLRQLFA